MLIVLALGLAVVLSACGTADPELSGNAAAQVDDEPSGRIVFISDGNVAIWSDGDIEQLTDFSGGGEYSTWAASPSWAPGGDRIAYVEMHDEAYSDVVVADQDGETLKQVTNNRPDEDPYSEEFVCYASWALDPVWSPAGEQIIWVSDRGGWEPYNCESRLSDPLYLWYSETWDAPPYLLEAAGDLNVPQEDPTLSPDGDQAAFVARVTRDDGQRTTEIRKLDLNTAESATLVSHPDGAYDPAWSPDGQNIAFVRRDATRNDVWIAPVDGGEPYQLTNIGTCVSPAWSPDGKYLAFFRLQDGAFEAWYVEVRQDSNGRLVASNPARLFSADDIDASSGMSWAK